MKERIKERSKWKKKENERGRGRKREKDYGKNQNRKKTNKQTEKEKRKWKVCITTTLFKVESILAFKYSLFCKLQLPHIFWAIAINQRLIELSRPLIKVVTLMW